MCNLGAEVDILSAVWCSTLSSEESLDMKSLSLSNSIIGLSSYHLGQKPPFKFQVFQLKRFLGFFGLRELAQPSPVVSVLRVRR